jgi:hypothetical protein
MHISMLDLQRGAVHAFDCVIIINVCLATPSLSAMATVGWEVACIAAADLASTGVWGQGSPCGGAHGPRHPIDPHGWSTGAMGSVAGR